MLALAIVIAVLVLIALLRFGVIAEYSESGFDAWIKVGFFKLKVYGEGVKQKPKKKKDKKSQKSIDFKELMPGSFSEFKNDINAVFNMLGRLRRRLLIKQLTLYYTAAGEDPANTALQFGAANALFGAITAKIKTVFRVRHTDLRTWFDFTSQEQKIYAKAVISIAVWEIVYIISALFPIIIGIFKKAPKRKNDKNVKPEVNDRKDGQNDGEKTDQRPDGNDNAENEGND